MRKQIAAANWKMNLGYQEAEQLLKSILDKSSIANDDHLAIFAVPSPYLQMAEAMLQGIPNYFPAAQNCYSKVSGAYTGEVSVAMLTSLNIPYVIIGHSERREIFGESNKLLADKVDICLQYEVAPIFCCGEMLPIREAGNQDQFVATQLEESLFHLTPQQAEKIIIAYEPIWAIGTGRTATSAQAQQMHAFIRSHLQKKFGDVAETISILYGGSVKPSNAAELFSQPDVDGGLIGGASLVVDDFVAIIEAMK